MESLLQNRKLLIDFDSTFIQLETIDEIAKISLYNDTNKKNKLKEINEITNKAMSGKISFSEALNERLKILKISVENIHSAIKIISNKISISFLRNKDFIKLNSNDIWIVSGGFKDIINPIVKEFGINPDRVIANSFLIEKGKIIGIDQKNPLSQDRGKIKAIKKLNFFSDTIMIGDGYTDYEVYIENACNHFIYFSENILRAEVASKSKYIANSFEEVLDIVSNLD